MFMRLTRVHGNKWPMWINMANIHSMEFAETNVYDDKDQPSKVTCTKINYGDGEETWVKETVDDIMKHCDDVVSTVGGVADEIDEFQVKCDESDGTDVGEAWELLNKWREQLRSII